MRVPEGGAPPNWIPFKKVRHRPVTVIASFFFLTPCTAKPSGDTSSSPSAHSDHAKASCAADAMQDLSVNVSTLTSSLDDADVGGEETVGDLAKRSCPHCQKVFIKPSDLKRHLMVHTGERPFVCHVRFLSSLLGRRNIQQQTLVRFPNIHSCCLSFCVQSVTMSVCTCIVQYSSM